MGSGWQWYGVAFPQLPALQPCAWLTELTLSWPVGSCGPHSHSISLSGQQDAQRATWRQSGFGRREVHQVKLDDSGWALVWPQCRETERLGNRRPVPTPPSPVSIPPHLLC